MLGQKCKKLQPHVRRGDRFDAPWTPIDYDNEYESVFCVSFPTEVLGLVADSVRKLPFSALCGPN